MRQGRTAIDDTGRIGHDAGHSERVVLTASPGMPMRGNPSYVAGWAELLSPLTAPPGAPSSDRTADAPGVQPLGKLTKARHKKNHIEPYSTRCWPSFDIRGGGDLVRDTGVVRDRIFALSTGPSASGARRPWLLADGYMQFAFVHQR